MKETVLKTFFGSQLCDWLICDQMNAALPELKGVRNLFEILVAKISLKINEPEASPDLSSIWKTIVIVLSG